MNAEQKRELKIKAWEHLANSIRDMDATSCKEAIQGMHREESAYFLDQVQRAGQVLRKRANRMKK